jgi:hypothetical protein
MLHELIKIGLKTAVKFGVTRTQKNGLLEATKAKGDILLEKPISFFYKQRVAFTAGIAVVAGKSVFWQIIGHIPISGLIPGTVEFLILDCQFKKFDGRTPLYLGLKDTHAIEVFDVDGSHLLAFGSASHRDDFFELITKLKQ